MKRVYDDKGDPFNKRIIVSMNEAEARDLVNDLDLLIRKELNSQAADDISHLLRRCL